MGSPWIWVTVLGLKKTGATRPRKKLDDIFSRLDTIHECDSRKLKHRPTASTGVRRLNAVSRGKI